MRASARQFEQARPGIFQEGLIALAEVIPDRDIFVGQNSVPLAAVSTDPVPFAVFAFIRMVC
jgi:hypothetical protein